MMAARGYLPQIHGVQTAHGCQGKYILDGELRDYVHVFVQ